MDVVRYIVTVSESVKEVNITVDGSESSANVTNLTPGTDYWIRITALGKDGQTSPPSDVLATTTLISGEMYNYMSSLYIILLLTYWFWIL